MGSRFRGRVVSAAAIAALTAGMVSFAPVATAASSCPSVDRQTGAVTPSPAPGVDWTGCDLDYADLAGANLTGANLPGVTLAYANLSGATLSGAEMYDAMTGFTDLSSADLTNTDLSYASFLETSLDQADLAGAKLDYVHSRDITGTPATIPPNWRITDGYLIGPVSAPLNADLGSRLPLESRVSHPEAR